MVASDGPSHGRQRGVVVDGAHVLGRDARDGCEIARQLSTRGNACAPAGVWCVVGSIGLGRRPASRLLRLAQRCGDVIRRSQRAEGRGVLGVGGHVVHGARRGGRHVHGCVEARVGLAVERRLFVCVLERVVLHSDGRACELR